MMNVNVRSRIEPDLKNEAAALLKASGLDISTAIRLFLRSVVDNGGLPIEIPRPNPTTLSAIKAAKTGKTTPTDLTIL